MSAPHLQVGAARPDEVSREFAWHVHDAQEEWTGRADVKASVALAFEAGLAVVMVTANDATAPLHSHELLPRVIGLSGVGLVLIAVIAAGLAVFPITRPVSALRTESDSNFIYFGHLRHVPRAELTRRLAQLTPAEELAMLARQIAVTSRLNWWKHRLLQISVIGAVLALLALATSTLAFALV